MSNDRFDVREIPWQGNKTSIRQLTFRNLKRQFPSTVRAERPARALSGADMAKDTRHIAAFSPTGPLIGTVRLQRVDDDEARRAYDLEGLPDWVAVGELFGLAVADDFRDTPLPVELLTAAYKRARSLGYHAIVARVWLEQVMMYESFGFFRYHPGYKDAERGFVVPMMLDLHDVAYLRQVGSPLTRLAQRYLNPGEHSGLLLARYADVVAETRPPRARVVPAANPPTDEGDADTGAELNLDLDALSRRLGKHARQRLGAGTRLIAPDLPSRDIYLIVSGTLGVNVDGGAVPAMYLRDGDVIAETAFAPAGATLPLTVATLSECVVLRMTPSQLERLTVDDPALALRVLYRLVGGMATRLARHLAHASENG